MKEAQFQETNKEKEEEEVKEVKLPITLVRVPTEFGLAFDTPEGALDMNQYLVWLGNIILDLKKKLVGN